MPKTPPSSRTMFEADPDAYVSLVCGEMLASCAPHCRWIDAFCEVGAFDADQCRAGSRPAAPSASACASTVTSSGRGMGCGSQSSWELPQSTHCTYLTDADIEALAGSSTVATFLRAYGVGQAGTDDRDACSQLRNRAVWAP